MATLFNQSSDLIENYKGHIELLDTSDATWYNPDELLDWTISTIVDTEKHYSTNGTKKKTITGNSSAYEFRVKRTADFYDPLSTPVQTKTISYWKSLIYATPPTLPMISLRGVSESNAATSKFVVDEFTATVENIDEPRTDGLGAEEIIVSGEIITHTSNRRLSAAP
jgi:hypothetical protein